MPHCKIQYLLFLVVVVCHILRDDETDLCMSRILYVRGGEGDSRIINEYAINKSLFSVFLFLSPLIPCMVSC